MKRIQIIGCSGAGKTTLAADLSAHLNIPWYSLDQLYWNPGWVLSEPEERTRRLQPVLGEDAWIIEGNYSETMPQRLRLVDTLVFLDLPPRIYIPRVIWRSLKYRGETRPHMPDGCPERFDFEFLHYVITFKSRKRAGLMSLFENFIGNKVHLTSRKMVADFLSTAA
ncbi:MAG: hypothetical protein ABJN40_02480 [Sneathiella sp.]